MSEYTTDSFSRKGRNTFWGATTGAAVLLASLVIYSRAHEEPIPVKLPEGAVKVSNGDNDRIGTYLVPSTSIDQFDCGGKERPLATDLHNDKEIVGELGKSMIVACTDHQREILPE